MATKPGLDPSNINLYGAAPADTEEYQRALQSSVDALQQRYENPNWFNVAAGFFKPQLGGFSASLGSAGQALGENLEKQRESQLPIAQMRAQLAASKIAMGQKASASELVAGHKGPVTEELLKQVIARTGADSPVAQGIKAQLEGERANQSLLSQQQSLRQAQGAQALQLAQQQFSSGAISREEYQQQLAAIKGTYSPTQPVTPTRPAGAPGATPTSEAMPSGAPPGGSPATTDYSKESSLRGIADVSGIPVDVAKEISETKAMIPGLTGKDRENAIQYLADLEAKGTGGAPSTAPKQEKVVISSPFATNEQGLDPDTLRSQVAINETAAKAKYDSLEKAAGPVTYKSARSVIDDQMNLIKNNPELAKQVTAILSKGDFASQIGTMLEKGVGVSLGGISGQIHLPVAAIKQAGFNDKQRELAQTMANNYAKIAIYQQKLNSVNPNAASNAEAGLYNGIVPTMDTTPNAALRAMGHLRIDLDATNAQYKFANEVYHGRNPNISVGKNVPDRYSAILSHPAFDAVYDPYGAEHKDLSNAFQRLLAVKKP